MAAYNRDAALERKQIHEISLNVARRLARITERSRAAPAHVVAEVGVTARIISEIQSEIDQLMGSLPARAMLEMAVLTHVLGSHRRALDLLEVLERKLAAFAPERAPGQPNAHAALLAMSREIEQDAMRQGKVGPQSRNPVPGPALVGPAPGPAQQRAPQRDAPQRDAARPAAAKPPASAPRKPGKRPARPGSRTSVLGSIHAALTHRNAAAAFAVLSVVAGLSVAGLSFMQLDGAGPHRADAAFNPEKKLDGRLGATEQAALAEDPGAPPPIEEEVVVPPDPGVEQPYLVVLTTRRSTEELQQDLRSLKGAYPDLLGNAKARVDRIQGQDKQTWYRMSLIPPRSHADAKTLCSDLRTAGMTGCWIKPVPLARGQQ